MNQQEISIPELVVESVEGAVAVVKDLFKVDDVKPFAKVIAAMRNLTPEAHKEVSVPVINGVCAALNVDPQNTDEVANYVDILALAIQDAVNYMVQHAQAQMEQRARAQAALSQGRGNMLAANGAPMRG